MNKLDNIIFSILITILTLSITFSVIYYTLGNQTWSTVLSYIGVITYIITSMGAIVNIFMMLKNRKKRNENN